MYLPEVVPFQNRTGPVSNRKYFRLETGVLPFQTGSTPVWKQEYYRIKQVVLPFGKRSTTVSNGSTLDWDKNGTECPNQLEWVKFFLFWPIPEDFFFKFQDWSTRNSADNF